MENCFNCVNIYSFKLLASNHIYFVFFQAKLNPKKKKNANLTQFKKQRRQRFHLKWSHFYSCRLCLGHRRLIFKCYSLWELDFQYFVPLTGFKFQILPCVKISFQSVCPRRMIIRPNLGVFLRWTLFRALLKMWVLSRSFADTGS